jgi:hypothetical protein
MRENTKAKLKAAKKKAATVALMRGKTTIGRNKLGFTKPEEKKQMAASKTTRFSEVPGLEGLGEPDEEREKTITEMSESEDSPRKSPSPNKRDVEVIQEQTSEIESETLTSVKPPTDNTSDLESRDQDELLQPKNEDEKAYFERCKMYLGVHQYSMVSNSRKLEKLILVRSICDQTLSKLKDTDQVILKGVIGDIFRSCPDVERGTQLQEDICTTMKAQGYEPQEQFVQSIVQLNEIVTNRHGSMIVGPSMSGKTTALRLLEETYNYR